MNKQLKGSLEELFGVILVFFGIPFIVVILFLKLYSDTLFKGY